MLDLNELTARCGPCQTDHLQREYRKQLEVNLQKARALEEVLARELNSLGVERKEDPESRKRVFGFSADDAKILSELATFIRLARQPNPQVAPTDSQSN